MSMTLLVDEEDLPDDMPVILNGTLSKHGGNLLTAWFGNGSTQRVIRCDVVIGKQNKELSDEAEPGCADCGSDPAKCDCGRLDAGFIGPDAAP